MAFPAAGTPVSSTFASSTTHNVTMPATVNAGDLLIVQFEITSATTSVVTTPAGWTQIYQATDETAVSFASGVWIKKAAGTEGGGTVNFATDVAGVASALAVRITGWNGTLANVTASAANAFYGSATITPLIVTSALGSADNLFIAAAGWGDDAGTVSSFSSSYTNTASVTTGGSNTGSGCGMCFRELAAASDTPGTWTLSEIEAGWAVTIVVPPLPPALTGISATGSPGTVVPSRTVAVTGAASTGSAGSVSPNRTIAITGIEATASPGTLTASINSDVNVALTGIEATASPGTVVPSRDVAVTGSEATGSAGAVTPSRSVALSGDAATAGVGSVTQSRDVALTGDASVVSAGDLGVIVGGDITVALTGASVAVDAGAVVASGGVTESTGGGAYVKPRRRTKDERGRQWRETLARMMEAEAKKTPVAAVHGEPAASQAEAAPDETFTEPLDTDALLAKYGLEEPRPIIAPPAPPKARARSRAKIVLPATPVPVNEEAIIALLLAAAA